MFVGESGQLPVEIINFRRRVIDLLWDSQRYVTFGMADRALSGDAFGGRCLGCGGPLDVRFHHEEESVTLKCVFKGCEIADAVNDRLGLVAE